MGHRLLAAATLMLITTASAWAESSDGTAKAVTPGSVAQQPETTLDDLRQYSWAQKGDALEAARRGLADLDRKISELETQLDSQWPTLPETARLRKYEALSSLKQEQQRLAEACSDIRDAGKDSWNRVMDRLEQQRTAFQKSWRAITVAEPS